MAVASPLADAARGPRPFQVNLELIWPKETIPGSTANYWVLDYDTINNMQWTVTQTDQKIPVFQEPHACVVGTVHEVKPETDGDTHIWLILDGTSGGRFACEITPQNPIRLPNVGDHVKMYGIFRYDLQHKWPEMHPVDRWVLVPGAAPVGPVPPPAKADVPPAGLPGAAAPEAPAATLARRRVRTRFPYRLGRNPKIIDPRTFRLATYLKPELPAAPPTVNFTDGIQVWGMLGNDRWGDCTCAAAAHMEMVWTAEIGQPTDFTDQQVVDFYNQCTTNPDGGCNMLTVLNNWRNLGIADKKIFAFAEVPVTDLDLVRQATSIFSGLDIGIALPLTAQTQDVWDVVGDGPDSAAWTWGGHAVSVVSYDQDGLTVVTWGSLKRMTWAFWQKYVEEAYAIIPQDFAQLPAGQKIVGAIDFDQLKRDLEAIGGVNPPPPPVQAWAPGIATSPG